MCTQSVDPPSGEHSRKPFRIPSHVNEPGKPRTVYMPGGDI